MSNSPERPGPSAYERGITEKLESLTEGIPPLTAENVRELQTRAEAMSCPKSEFVCSRCGKTVLGYCLVDGPGLAEQKLFCWECFVSPERLAEGNES